jgi:hypothetical protein
VSPKREQLEQRGFADAELLVTVVENLGAGIDDKLPPVGRFLLNVTRAVRRRLHSAPGTDTSPAFFFFLAGSLAPPEATRFEPLLHTGARPMASQLWFVGEVATNARGVAIDPWDDADAHNFATQTLGVGDWPAVVFDPRPASAAVWFYPLGLANGDATEIPLDVSSLRLADIVAKVTEVHRRFLATPGAHPSGSKLWAKASAYWPVENAEKRVQSTLLVGLQMAFPTCDVREEREGVTGRIDLEIHAPLHGADGHKAPAALLELKVLRSFRSTGSTVSAQDTSQAIREGVIQAASYRDERGFPEAALCCFDMRSPPDEKGCFSHVRHLASRRKILLKSWPIFNRAKLYRDYLNAPSIGAQRA